MNNQKGREPIRKFLISQARFFARSSEKPEDRAAAQKFVTALRDEHKIEKLLEDIEV